MTETFQLQGQEFMALNGGPVFTFSPAISFLVNCDVFEARDLNHAIQLMSKHPAVKARPIEIRPVEDFAEMIRESERRRSNTEGN